jgi:hypothetical protein
MHPPQPVKHPDAPSSTRTDLAPAPPCIAFKSLHVLDVVLFDCEEKGGRRKRKGRARKKKVNLRGAHSLTTHTHKPADAQPAFLFEVGERSREAYFVEMALASLSSNSVNDTRCPTSRSMLAIPQPLTIRAVSISRV